MALDWLLVALAICIFAQPDRRRGLIALVYVGAVLGYDFVGAGLGGFWYFLGAAVVDFGVVLLLCRFKSDAFVLGLQILSCVSIAGNLFGWVLYELESSPSLYTDSFLLIYALAVFVLLAGGFNVLGVFKDYWRSIGFFRPTHAGGYVHASTRRKENL